MNCGIKAGIVSVSEANNKRYVDVERNTDNGLASGEQAQVKQFLSGKCR